MAPVATAPRVSWTADDGREVSGNVLRIDGPWATIQADDGQLLAVPANALRQATAKNGTLLLI